MRNSAAARRYARALFSIAQDGDSTERVREQLAKMDRLFESEPALRHALFRPLHPVAQRREVLGAVCQRLGFDDSVRNFFAFLIDQRRLVEFDTIRSEFEQLAAARAGRVTAVVTAAAPLDDAQRARLQGALAARTGRRVELEVAVDPELIGGAVAVVGNVVFDGSLRTQLHQLRNSLSKGH